MNRTVKATVSMDASTAVTSARQSILCLISFIPVVRGYGLKRNAHALRCQGFCLRFAFRTSRLYCFLNCRGLKPWSRMAARLRRRAGLKPGRGLSQRASLWLASILSATARARRIPSITPLRKLILEKCLFRISFAQPATLRFAGRGRQRCEPAQSVRQRSASELATPAPLLLLYRHA